MWKYALEKNWKENAILYYEPDWGWGGENQYESEIETRTKTREEQPSRSKWETDLHFFSRITWSIIVFNLHKIHLQGPLLLTELSTPPIVSLLQQATASKRTTCTVVISELQIDIYVVGWWRIYFFKKCWHLSRNKRYLLKIMLPSSAATCKWKEETALMTSEQFLWIEFVPGFLQKN